MYLYAYHVCDVGMWIIYIKKLVCYIWEDVKTKGVSLGYHLLTRKHHILLLQDFSLQRHSAMAASIRDLFDLCYFAQHSWRNRVQLWFAQRPGTSFDDQEGEGSLFRKSPTEQLTCGNYTKQYVEMMSSHWVCKGRRLVLPARRPWQLLLME